MTKGGSLSVFMFQWVGVYRASVYSIYWQVVRLSAFVFVGFFSDMHRHVCTKAETRFGWLVGVACPVTCAVANFFPNNFQEITFNVMAVFPLFQLATSPGFHANHIPEGNLVIV